MAYSNLKHNKNGFFEGPFIFEPKIFKDARGIFYESWNKNRFEEKLGHKIDFIQDNVSISSKGVLRGIHYQIGKKSQGKLVRCSKGSLLDVIVDLRKYSKTFKYWGSVNLSSSNNLQLWIPTGFGHAFLSLENETMLEYKVTNYWSKDHERTLIWNDKTINIAWPDINLKYNISTKDLNGLTLEKLNLSNSLFI